NIHLLSILFLCYCSQSSLHSFPTRRSSDLGFGNVKICNDRFCLPHQKVVTRMNNTRQIQPIINSTLHAVINAVPIKCGLPIQSVDRKSTRLNSSHVKISYAVVCLKKKIAYN